jgi:hypothetical protein
MDLPTRQDLFNIGRAYILDRATKIDPAQVDIQGSDVNLFVGASSVIAHALIAQLGYQISRLFLDGAKDNEEDQDRLAWDRYRLPRKGASAAIATVVFSRPTADAEDGTIPTGTVLMTVNDVQYVTTSDAIFGGDTLSTTATAQAVQAGKEYQVGANYITRIRDAVFDDTIMVTNPEPSEGGEAREDVDTFDLRIRDFWNSARRGTLSAIEFGALTVPGVTSAKAIEVLDPQGNPNGAVMLYFADSSGVANSTMVPLVRTALSEWRAAGIYVQIVAGMPQIVNISLHLQFTVGADASSLTNIVRAAVVEYVNSLPITAILTRAGLFSLLQRYVADGLVVGDGAIVEPVGDLVPDVGRTIRTTINNVTVVQ